MSLGLDVGNGRTPIIDHLGRRMLRTPEDIARQREVAAIIERAWGCKVHEFAPYDSIDWWIEKNELNVCYAELKSRSKAMAEYNVCWLDLDKWWALTQISRATGRQARFVARFADGVRWIRVDLVDPRPQKIVTRTLQGPIPTILVPIDSMEVLAGWPDEQQ